MKIFSTLAVVLFLNSCAGTPVSWHLAYEKDGQRLEIGATTSGKQAVKPNPHPTK